MERVLITGAAGAIGTALRHGLRGCYPALRLSDVAPLGEAAPGEELIRADLRNLAEVEAAVAGVGAVVHLGATATEADWETIHDNNITGAYHVFEAARRQGVRRVVFASSIHVVGFHRRERPLGPDLPLRPDSRYGLTKAFGEVLGRFYADKYGLGVICLRIGAFQPRPQDTRMLSTWISPRDMVQLVRRCLDAADVHFEVVYGLSANERDAPDDPAAARLGYRPVDNAEAYAAEIRKHRAGEGESEVERMFRGGRFCEVEFSGDPFKID